MRELELYIHIPFCVRKCKYCDFLSAPADAGERQKYVESLCRKIRSYGALAKAYHVVSIFLGGGTPSVLDAGQTEKIFDAVYDTFMVDKDAEITTELNPGTVTEEKLRMYQKVGINRLSIGLQSVNNHELRMLGRIHTYEDFIDTFVMARKTGFDNVNVDLISAIPGQTVESWEDTLRTVAELEPEHISAYSLIIEEGTPFYEIYGEEGAASGGMAVLSGEGAALPDEDAEREMYQRTKRILEEYGYRRYEISNYAKEGFRCRHNLGYWERREYLGIGLGAASLIDNVRWNEYASVEEFCRKYGEGIEIVPEFICVNEPESITGSKVKVPREDGERLSVKEQMGEFMFLGLRKMEGISKERFLRTFHEPVEKVYADQIPDLCEKCLLECEGDFIRLTERGIDISNYVMSEFI